EAEAIRIRAAGRMRALAPGTGQVIAADTAVDGDITIPGAVMDEAAAVAAGLGGKTAQPVGASGWGGYHGRFRERYGPGAVVPVRELVADSGLGFPAGFLGSPRRKAVRSAVGRDAALLALIQEAVIDGRPELDLTEPVIASLTVGDPGQAIAPDR